MDSLTFDILAKKLQNAPQSVLDRVIGYVDALIESSSSNTKKHTLTNEQQQILDSQIDSDKSKYTDAETLFTDLKSKYEL